MAFQSLYRRYRPQRFADVRGQEPVVRALRNAVRDGRVGHAYLFSGPRGTGKTSTARILAKALNCTNPQAGEPDCECESCVAMEAGRSYDLQELDAASNSGVEAMRSLIDRVALGSPGRTKVYILDEVHMLTAAASNALLKTLEEPPPHVVFVLATTDPHKVLPTIRSRTQHFEFHLLPAEELAEHVRWVVHDAELHVSDEAIAQVLRAGGGSARDTLSALDRIVASGGIGETAESVDHLLDAIAERDTALALQAVSDAVATGRDPRVLGEELLGRLRDVFLQRMGGTLTHLTDTDQEVVADLAGRFTDRTTTRALEQVGEALLEMRQAPDPRIPLEVALVRLTNSHADASIDSLIARIDELERRLAGGAPASNGPAAAAPAATATGGLSPVEQARAQLAARGIEPPPPEPPAPPAPQPSPSSVASSPEPGNQPTTDPAEVVAPAPASERPGPPPTPPPSPAAAPAAPRAQAPPAGPPAPAPAGAAGGLPDRDALTMAWSDNILPTLSGLTKAMFSAGRFTKVTDRAAVFALPNAAHRDRCAGKLPPVEEALAKHFGRPVPLELIVDEGPEQPALLDPSPAAAPSGRPAGDGTSPSSGGRPATTPTQPEPDDEPFDHRDLENATDQPADGVARVTQAFPGAQLVDDER